MTDNGVTAHLADGHMERGSIIVGADGTYSSLRRILVAQEPRSLNGQATFSKHSFKTIYGRARLSTRLEEDYKGYMLQVHRPGWFMQIIPSGTYDGLQEICFGLYEYQGETTDSRHQFTEDETNAFAAKYYDELLVKEANLTVGDLWENRTFAKLDWMHEGISERWFHRRAVFVGDAAGKVCSQHCFKISLDDRNPSRVN